MDITLEKIELVRDRTGVTYKEARQALEQSNADVVEAIIKIEENINNKRSKNFANTKDDILNKLREVIKKGNVSKIVFKKNEEVLLNIPVTASVVGVLLAPTAASVGIIAALITKCKVELIKNDGEVIDFNKVAEERIKDVKNMTEDTIENVKEKVKDYTKKNDDDEE